LYVCKANNNVKEGRCFNIYPKQNLKKTEIKKSVQKIKPETKTQSHEKTNNDQKTESKNFTETYSPVFEQQISFRNLTRKWIKKQKIRRKQQ